MTTLSVSANGPFTFATPLACGAGYNVTVKTSPSGQTCTVSNGSGTVASANVTNVAVSCTNIRPRRLLLDRRDCFGAVRDRGLQDNGGDDLSVSSNGSFTFATAVMEGAGYNVTVRTNPSGQTCTVTGGSGTVGSAA